MKTVDLERLRKAIGVGRIEWRKHVLQKLAERGLAQIEVLNVLRDGDKIRDYSDDKPFPSALFLGYVVANRFMWLWPMTRLENRRSS